MWKQIEPIISGAEKVVITTHVNPDGDGVGAACALVELLKQRGKEVRFICDSPIPEKFRFLDFHNTFEEYSEEGLGEALDVLIVLDTHRKDRIGRLQGYITENKVDVVCIDHHSPSELFTPYTVIDASSCSVGAMIYHYFQFLGHPINLNAAQGIYSSLLCDTGRFSYSSTNREAYQIAEHCIQIGVHPQQMYSRLFQQVPIEEAKLFAEVLGSSLSFLGGQLHILKIGADTIDKYSISHERLENLDFEFMLEFVKTIKGSRGVALLREIPGGKVRVSLRSKKEWDVSLISQKVGGGGHSKAAGATIEGTLDEVEAKLVSLFEGTFLAENAKL